MGWVPKPIGHQEELKNETTCYWRHISLRPTPLLASLCSPRHLEVADGMTDTWTPAMPMSMCSLCCHLGDLKERWHMTSGHYQPPIHTTNPCLGLSCTLRARLTVTPLCCSHIFFFFPSIPFPAPPRPARTHARTSAHLITCRMPS
jgi:hypothetical protein